jgi:hypothetical protein
MKIFKLNGSQPGYFLGLDVSEVDSILRALPKSCEVRAKVSSAVLHLVLLEKFTENEPA